MKLYLKYIVKSARKNSFLAVIVTLTFLVSNIISFLVVFNNVILIGDIGENYYLNSSSFIFILSKNLPAILLLYSGVITLGLTSLIGIFLIGAFIGGVTAISVYNIGWMLTLQDVWLYAPLEFLAFIIATIAGMSPIYNTVLSHNKNIFNKYQYELKESLILLSVSLLILIFSAFVEVIAIYIRG